MGRVAINSVEALIISGRREIKQERKKQKDPTKK
jgi:hypothetical protein